MKKVTKKRREFLKLLLAPMLFNYVGKAGSAHLVQSPSQVKCGNDEARKVCVEVYEQWRLNEPANPEVYFYSMMDLYGLDSSQVSDAVKLDFQSGNFFEIKGMVLGRTEASLIAYLGGQLC